MHHTRRKSGNTSVTDMRKVGTDGTRHKSSRPAQPSRRSTPKDGTPRVSRTPRERERPQAEEDRWWEDERESFPQFCMYCEKQFVPADHEVLYCSKECRTHDQLSESASNLHLDDDSDSYPFYSVSGSEARDIIPRASPSRPSSTYDLPPVSPSHMSAVSALRSLSKLNAEPPSPTQTNGPLSIGIWPFTRSAAVSPSTSYTKTPAGAYPSTYDYGYCGAHSGYGMASTGPERPLPMRRPGTYSRPKSIELVTPMIGR